MSISVNIDLTELVRLTISSTPSWTPHLDFHPRTFSALAVSALRCLGSSPGRSLLMISTLLLKVPSSFWTFSTMSLTASANSRMVNSCELPMLI